MINEMLVNGVDQGSESAGSIIANMRNGHEIVSSVLYYPRWKDGLFWDAASNQVRRDPLDYAAALAYPLKKTRLYLMFARFELSFK